MSKKLFYLLGIAATIILGTILYLKFCCNCCVPTKTVDNTETTVDVIHPNRSPFVLNGSGINYQCNDNFNFLKNSSAFVTPISDSITVGLENLKTILIANPQQKISITGFATSDEKNNSKFENLGLARANDVKAYFVSKGLPAAQFDTKGEIIENWEMISDTLLGPMQFNFNELITNQESTNSSKDQINANPLVLHFNTNQSDYNLNAEELQKVKNISNYISKNSGETILVIGHSDNSGNRGSNILLAKKRAEFTKNYLVKNGLQPSAIEVQSKGPDEPVAENQTPEGKAKNRRTVITIK